MPQESPLPAAAAAAAKKKRPMGLKARAANKKQKNNTETSEPTGINDFDEASMATIMLKNTTGENGEATEVDELEGIFDNAMAELGADSTERALTLLRGTIHECDRILRLHHHDANEVPLEPKFYYIYGTALYSITKLAEEDEDIKERKEYLELALERLDQARGAITGAEPFAWRVHVGMAKAALELLAFNGDDGLDVPLQSLDSALAAMEHDPATQTDTESLAIVDLVLSLADSRRFPPLLNAKLVAWGETKLRVILEDSQSADARYLLARALWLQASELLDAQEEEEEEEDERIAEEAKIKDLLSKANELLEDGASSDALLLRGEAILNLGNVQDDDNEQEKFYGMAVDAFKRAQKLGDIPDQFVQLINDFEQDDDDDDKESGE
ncbi:hypothetical protein GGI22_001359 [Coemansia erecta]|nr:hypothetical protein GGI22_001359 [Coemansia erecta]